jgi:hypothetical protein
VSQAASIELGQARGIGSSQPPCLETRSSPSRWLPLAALLLACGDDGDGETTGFETTNGNGRSDAADVDRFLMRKGEEPGFRPDGDASTVVGVNPFANGPELSRADAQQLRENGFISFTMRRTLAGDDVAAGVSEVLLFATPEGARSWMTHELRARTINARVPKTEIRRFTVARRSGRAGLDRERPARQSHRHRAVGAGPLQPRARQRGRGLLRRGALDRCAGDLRAHRGRLPVIAAAALHGVRSTQVPQLGPVPEPVHNEPEQLSRSPGPVGLVG